MSAPTREQVEDFLIHEARLLDAQDWAAWNALFTDDGIYWMPAAPGQEDAKRHVSLIHDDPLLREVRLRRFEDSNAFSLQRGPRGWRMVGNVLVEGQDPATCETIVTSRLAAAEYQDGHTVRFEGFVTHRLVTTEEGLRIRLKRVDLLNCDAPQDDINLYL